MPTKFGQSAGLLVGNGYTCIIWFSQYRQFAVCFLVLDHVIVQNGHDQDLHRSTWRNLRKQQKDRSRTNGYFDE
jgi:hypothetical protein